MTNNTRALKIIFASRIKKPEFLTEGTGNGDETKLIKDESKFSETLPPGPKIPGKTNHVNP